MSPRAEPRLSKLPFVLADILLLGVAGLICWRSEAPMTPWDMFFCTASVALGALLCVAPFLLEYRAAVKLTESDRLAAAVLQIENIEIIGRQINLATANWQTAHEEANKTVEAAREIAASISSEAQSFSEFLKKANDTEKSHLRLEVDKLRRAESEWLQILVRILDHTFALNQAAVRSGQASLVKKLGQFQLACRDVARRVGLVPFVAMPGEPYDPKIHQLADAKVIPPAAASVAETIATGYSFQGQLVRPALVTLQPTPDASEDTAGQPEAEAVSVEQPHGVEPEPEFSATPAEGIPHLAPVPSPQIDAQEPLDSRQEQFRS
jgi:molecular chaperone GrpE (heat shock protein)